jgi:hypothetical protein
MEFLIIGSSSFKTNGYRYITSRAITNIIESSDAYLDTVYSEQLSKIMFSINKLIYSQLFSKKTLQNFTREELNMLMDTFVEESSADDIYDFKYRNDAAMVTYFVSSITILILNYHLLYIHDFSSYEVGLILLVTPTVMTIVSLFAGRLSDKYDLRLISGIALSIILISVVFLLHLVYVSFDLVIIASIIQGIGHGLFSSPNNKYVLTRVSDEDLPDASSLLSTSKEFGKMLSGNMYTFICIVAFGEMALGPNELDFLLLNVDFMMIFITVLVCLSGVIMVFVSKYILKSYESESC